MIDKDRIIADQQKKIERIEKLQEVLHAISMFGLFTLKVLGIPDKDGTLEGMMDIMHKLSHVIEDVLEGADPKKAIKESLTSQDNDEEED
ncbi:hypothetical protein [Streptococcus pyogenes]|uniref:hypothetical protein n=1 Tax=Streptococcus pyogenes TaxID=1314 RepID=UPI00352B131C